jgi:hypothetical protein
MQDKSRNTTRKKVGQIKDTVIRMGYELTNAGFPSASELKQ